MAYKPLPIGTEDFKELIQKNYYYVDKTLWIKELIDRRIKVGLFTRPRRFGKTLNLSMLRYFFENTRDASVNEENCSLFDGLAIAEAGDEYTAHMQKYPVISLTLKSAKQANFEYAFARLKESIAKEFARHEDVVVPALLDEADREKYLSIRQRRARDEDYYSSIAFLSDCLFEAYGKRSIILLDEYDVPLENAYYRGFYDEMIDFIRSLFESALKTNPNLEFAVITGCLRISKESIFTGLNNLAIFSIRSQMYSEYFGFTQEETEEMLAYYDRSEHMETIRQWYDGYLFGNTEVYNPWSLLNYVMKLVCTTDTHPEPYWSNTSSNSIVRDLIQEADSIAVGELETLLAGGTIQKPMHEDITYADIRQNQDNLWNFLFFTGYLKKTGEVLDGSRIKVDLAIPNMEIRSIYEDKIRNWFDEKTKQKDLSALYQALMSGEAEETERELTDLLLESISYLDSAEAFYHGFLLGVLMNMNDGYIVKSNLESGNGRYDICVYNRNFRKSAAVIELKAVKRAGQMEKGAEEALRQIAEKKYDAWLGDLGYEECWHVGIGFCRKNCAVKIEKCAIDEIEE